MRRILQPLLSALLFTVLLAGPAATASKPRLLVLTDITNEPDDEQSMVRLLIYANEFDLEGLIATTSTHLRDQVRPEKIRAQIEAYGKVLGNLAVHAKGFPTKELLLGILKAGRPEYGIKGVGPGKSTEASRHIVEAVDKDDTRPVWVTVWGGSSDLAQALWDVKQTRSPLEVRNFVRKLCVYDIAGQDDTGAWICHTFPDIFWIRNSGIFQAISIRFKSPFPPEVTGPRTDLFSHEWVGENVQSHGPLGKLYPDAIYKYEGDTPAILYLLPNGLHEPEKVHYGGWGGRFLFEKLKNVAARSAKPREDERAYEDYWMYTDAGDTWSYQGTTYRTSRYATLFRWREAFQSDFAARMDWTVAREYGAANHNPVAGLHGDTTKDVVYLKVKPEQTVELNADGTADPDNDELTYGWWHYPEPGSYRGAIEIRNADQPRASFRAPEVDAPETIHIILEIRDNGEPSLFAYRRIVCTVMP